MNICPGVLACRWVGRSSAPFSMPRQAGASPQGEAELTVVTLAIIGTSNCRAKNRSCASEGSASIPTGAAFVRRVGIGGAAAAVRRNAELKSADGLIDILLVRRLEIGRSVRIGATDGRGFERVGRARDRHRCCECRACDKTMNAHEFFPTCGYAHFKSAFNRRLGCIWRNSSFFKMLRIGYVGTVHQA